MITIIIVLTLLTQPLTATWDGSTRARVTHGPGCLYRNATLIRCYDRAGVAIIGGKNTDGAFRVAANDVFTLAGADGAQERARLIGRVYLGAVGR